VSRAVSDAFASGSGSSAVASAFASSSAQAVGGGEVNATAIAEARALVQATALNQVCQGILLANSTAIAEVSWQLRVCSMQLV
jgi:hypothetical protein